MRVWLPRIKLSFDRFEMLGAPHLVYVVRTSGSIGPCHIGLPREAAASCAERTRTDSDSWLVQVRVHGANGPASDESTSKEMEIPERVSAPRTNVNSHARGKQD